jgi:glycosyltransferase involved in cell wall biosynthesis
MSRVAHSNDIRADLEAGTGEVVRDRFLPRLFLMTDSFETGGSERQFAELARTLSPAAYRIHLGCIQRRGGFADGLGYVPEFPLGGSLYGLESLWTRVRLAQYLRRNHIAIAHAFDFYTNLTLIPAAKLAGVPVVIGSQRQLGHLLSSAKSRAQAAAFGACDVVVCNSRAAADRLVEQGLRESRVVVIGNGLPASAFAETPPALPRRPGVLRVGMIARMNARFKNHKVFLHAAVRLCSRFSGLEFVLVGDGSLRAELEREADTLGLKTYVSFFGDRRDIPAVLASLDVSVLPSSSESLSNAILESMAAGVPVVASGVGGNPELVSRERGMLVAPDDDKSLADAIERLLRDPAMRADLGRNAKRFAHANFTAEHTAKRYEQLYAGLLEKKSGVANRRWAYGLGEEEERIRVAVVAASSRYVGGQSVQAGLLLRHWQDDSAVEARFIAIDPPLPRLLAWVQGIPFLRTLMREPFYFVSLWRGLRHVQIAHIFSASYSSFLLSTLPAWFVAWLRGTKTVIHYHSGEARDHLRRSRSARLVLEAADRLVVPSEYLAGVFHEFGLQAHVVPNMVDLTQFTFRVRQPVRPRLLFARGFHPYYSPHVAVRAFALIQRTYPEATLDLVGKGPLEPQIRSLVRELKLCGVNVAGAVAHPEMATFYESADIFINASSLDNMPVSILEAFASGLPVVTTAPEGMSYLVEHERTGLLSKPGDARALADNVVRLVAHPELATGLTLNALEEVQRYSWPAVRQQWLELYCSLEEGEVAPTHPQSSCFGVTDPMVSGTLPVIRKSGSERIVMKPPVFIVGCPRSGTSYLYHLLLSAGGFAEFRTQMNVFDVLEPIFGDLGVFQNKTKMMNEWLRSKAFKVSGLQAEEIKARVLAECRSASDFLRIVMEEVARKQGVDRWIDSTPTNIPHLLRIKKDFPDAKIIHIIRDGRDVALSLDRRGWSRPLLGDRNKGLLAAGLYWEWIVRKGRKFGSILHPDYFEVRYEHLVHEPAETLQQLAIFLRHDLDYGRIQNASIGSVKTPLTSFKEDLEQGQFTPVGRWRDENKFPLDQLVLFESLVGDYLQELGYELCGSEAQGKRPLAIKGMRSIYSVWYECKQWAKINTPLSRLMVNYSASLIDK